jgi:eukaryotic-like serine/threonine-protein kinase
LYQLAVAAGDDQAALAHLDWARDRPREFDMVGARAQAAGWSGRVREARELYEQAARMAERRNFPDIGASHLAWSTLMELAYGNTDMAVRVASRVLAHHPTYDPRLRVALVLAMGGSDREAQAIVNELSATNPEHTFINSVLTPIVGAGIELGLKHPEAAIEYLRAVAPYELGFIAALAPLYLRGLAYLMLGSGPQAAVEFQRILDHRGSDPFSPFHAVAPLGLARALAMAGDAAGSVRAYDRFLNAWSEADGDLPILLEARDEHARLDRRMRAAARTHAAGG